MSKPYKHRVASAAALNNLKTVIGSTSYDMKKKAATSSKREFFFFADRAIDTTRDDSWDDIDSIVCRIDYPACVRGVIC